MNIIAYPFKHIENNLVWNHGGECFTYYELIPYNTTTVFQVHENFRKLVAQNRDGKTYAIQLATESSIQVTQEHSKKEITGNLKDIVYQKIDE